MIIRPNSFTPSFDEEFPPNQPVTEEVVRKLVQNMNMLQALTPIGWVKPVHINIQGVPLPLSTLFQFCDGSEITEPSSPLNGAGPQEVPNLTGRYVRGGSATTNTLNELNGSATMNIQHTHAVGQFFNPLLLEEGDEQKASNNNHNHTIEDAFTDPVPLDLRHMEICFYLKIND